MPPARTYAKAVADAIDAVNEREVGGASPSCVAVMGANNANDDARRGIGVYDNSGVVCGSPTVNPCDTVNLKVAPKTAGIPWTS